MNTFTLEGNIVDILQRRIYPAQITVEYGCIVSILEIEQKCDKYILPGFIDAHVHIESSMIVPSEFARLAVVHGTVATVSDPHEIANVLGISGVEYMIDNGAKTPFKFNFGAPSCVPATQFETSGATVTAEDIRQLFKRKEVRYLSEMMNFPGVLFTDELVMEKLSIAKEFNRPIDGHAPGLRGSDARKYASAGISTDHECFTLEEALDKIEYGMKILIREGSAAKNYNALHPLLGSHPSECMFCSDDKHPDSLVESHINELVRRSMKLGYDVFDVLRVACINPIEHYKLEVGQLQVGDYADFICVKDLEDFNVIKTYISGKLVAENGASLIDSVSVEIVNNFSAKEREVSDFKIRQGKGKLRVIEALEGQLVTNEIHAEPHIENGEVISDIANDILKLTVINRYYDSAVSVGFVKGFGLKKGAIASCVAHDSHNIIAVGTSDEELCKAVNAVIRAKGGISVVEGENVDVLPLPIVGIMSDGDGYEVATAYSRLDSKAKKLGSSLTAPFMTLSFMALLVIPTLKLSDKGLFDGQNFRFTNIWTD
ncbi:MAG: adenine deaminase [Bacteroidetes bacterium]|nr:adenine deaminase [Bacteroidota bacterium]